MAFLISPEAWGVTTVWQESRGEPLQGQIAVAETIRNRAKWRYSSDGTIAGTVLRSLQFSGWNAHDPNRIPAAMLDDADPVVLRCREAWRTAMAGSDVARGAVLYYAPAVVEPPWAADCRIVVEIGRHRFLVPKHWTH